MQKSLISFERKPVMYSCMKCGTVTQPSIPPWVKSMKRQDGGITNRITLSDYFEVKIQHCQAALSPLSLSLSLSLLSSSVRVHLFFIFTLLLYRCCDEFLTYTVTNKH